MTIFLIKLNCEVQLNGAEPRPQEALQWEGQTISIPTPHLLGGDPGQQVSTGDTLIIWTHEDVSYGKGQGLTATAIVGKVDSLKGQVDLELRNVELIKPHFRLDRLPDKPTTSPLLNYLKSHRHTRTIEVTDSQADEFWNAINEIERNRQRQIALYSSTFKTDAQKAIEADSDKIYEGFNRRFAQIELRPDQTSFRNALMELYRGKCVMCHGMVTPVLQAAHIIPFSEAIEYRNDVTNGLLLRSDIHILFDLAQIAINPKSNQIVISNSLTGTLYANLAGRVVKHYANPEFIRRHYEEFLKRSSS